MSYLALYRKYRPTRFEDLIGQEHVVKTLVNQIESGRLGHAYLFTGTRGTGKTTVAKIFAKAINCEHPVNGSPCGKCEACKALSDPSNIDVLEIDAASNNGVNEIRELRENVQFPPASVKYKVYIVDEVHMLSGAAFNALLKTLEEPPSHAVFILATTEAHKIPATILSRCMRFDFRLVSTERIAELICKIYDEQGKKYEKEAITAIAKAGEGSVRDALSVADIAISCGDGILTYDDVNDVLGASNFDVLIGFTENVLTGNAGGALKTIDELASMGKSMGVLIKDVTSIIRDLLVVKTCSDAAKILAVPAARMNVLSSLAEKTNEQRLLRILGIFADAENTLKYSPRQRTVFETAAIKAARPDTDYDFDALLSRVKTLEEKLEKANFSVATATPAKNAKNTENVANVNEPPFPNIEENVDIPTILPETSETYPLEAVKLSDFTEEEIKGKLLTGLRKSGSEMLSIIVRNVDVKASGNTVYLVPHSEEDERILLSDSGLNTVKDALKEFGDITVTVKERNDAKAEEEIEEATDDIRKIFGDDIVIIKS